MARTKQTIRQTGEVVQMKLRSGDNEMEEIEVHNNPDEEGTNSTNSSRKDDNESKDVDSIDNIEVPSNDHAEITSESENASEDLSDGGVLEWDSHFDWSFVKKRDFVSYSQSTGVKNWKEELYKCHEKLYNGFIKSRIEQLYKDENPVSTQKTDDDNLGITSQYSSKYRHFSNQKL